jgi:hypothetical protein
VTVASFARYINRPLCDRPIKEVEVSVPSSSSLPLYPFGRLAKLVIASDYESGDCGFKSHVGLKFFPPGALTLAFAVV